jgi:repressor LexA
MYIVERIKYLRKQKKISLRNLAEQSKVSKTTINEIENGIVKNPTIDTLQKIVEALGFTLMDLWEDDLEYEDLCNPCEDDNDNNKNNIVRESATQYRTVLPELCSIPILGIISAGEPIRAIQNIIGYEYLPTDMVTGGEYFGLKVTGDSMNAARINDGDVVIVREQASVENGEIAIVMVDGENATVKLFYQTETTVTLIPQSINPVHAPRIIDITKESIKVLGKVVKVIISL